MLPDIIRRLFPRRDAEKRVLITGLGYTGKTTLLYRLCLGDVVTTIPTIGFNVESVRAPTSGGRPPLALNCWDVSGGCGRIQPLLQYYVAGTEALVWIIDSNERNYMAEVIEELRGTLGLVDENTRGDPIPCLILANKQDLPGAMGLDEIRMKLAPAISTRPSCAIFPTSLVTDAFFTTLTPAMDWLYDALNGIEPPQFTLDKPAPEALANPLAKKLMSWAERASEDVPAEDFLKAFEDISLPSWDHYTHIRIAYTVLKTYGRQKGKTMIFDGLERYIKFSSQTTGRTFHVTMTYFWVQIVHFGIQSMPHAHSVKDDTENKEFSRFLLLNPYVADGNLWADYYSKDVIMTPNAKQQMVLPDKKPLPSLIARDSIRR